jgi:ribosomal protein L11 methyltransferase
VIDVGCGSGILAIAALKLGASHVLAVDIDRQSPPIAMENAAANGVVEGMEAGLGSVGEILNGEFSIKQAPLVLANILAPILVRLFDAGMADLIIPGGGIVLSGILAEQWEDAGGTSPLREAVKARGLEIKDYRRSGDWIAVYLERSLSAT